MIFSPCNDGQTRKLPDFSVQGNSKVSDLCKGLKRPVGLQLQQAGWARWVPFAVTEFNVSVYTALRCPVVREQSSENFVGSLNQTDS
jgi:hypothetical protein